jgi:two-component system sensor histidine kinase KdpD
VLYVQTPGESADRISLANQRYLSNHFKLAAELGGEVIQVQSSDIMGSIIKICQDRQITTVCMGQPAFKIPQVFFKIQQYKNLIDYFSKATIDLIIVA